MIHFAWPFVFLCFPLPFLIDRWAKQGVKDNSAAIKVPFFSEIKAISKKKSVFSTTKKNSWLLWILWFLLLVAAARPQIPDKIQNYTIPVRDIMLAVDISRSMLHQDMGNGSKTRLDAVKQAASSFIAKRKNERIGIILFAEQTNLYMPLSVDTSALQTMLSGVQAGLLGSLTAVGDALGLSLQYLEKSQAKHKIIVLLTDGVNNAGNTAPQDALNAAKQKGVTVYTIGVGSDQNEYAAIDRRFLQALASQTNGLFFMADDLNSLMRAYERISQNEPLSEAAVYLIRQKELYFWPLLAFALIVSAVVFKRVMQRIAFRREDG